MKKLSLTLLSGCNLVTKDDSVADTISFVVKANEIVKLLETKDFDGVSEYYDSNVRGDVVREIFSRIAVSNYTKALIKDISENNKNYAEVVTSIEQIPDYLCSASKRSELIDSVASTVRLDDLIDDADRLLQSSSSNYEEAESLIELLSRSLSRDSSGIIQLKIENLIKDEIIKYWSDLIELDLSTQNYTKAEKDCNQALSVVQGYIEAYAPNSQSINIFELVKLQSTVNDRLNLVKEAIHEIESVFEVTGDYEKAYEKALEYYEICKDPKVLAEVEKYKGYIHSYSSV